MTKQERKVQEKAEERKQHLADIDSLLAQIDDTLAESAQRPAC